MVAFASSASGMMHSSFGNNSQKYGEVSKKILESFLKFVLRAEQTGQKNANQWAQMQDASGHNAITQLLLWTRELCDKPVFTLVLKYLNPQISTNK